MEKQVKVINKHAGGVGGFVCFLAFIGAVVYFIQQASSFGGYVIAILKAIIWPALVVYGLLEFLRV